MRVNSSMNILSFIKCYDKTAVPWVISSIILLMSLWFTSPVSASEQLVERVKNRMAIDNNIATHSFDERGRRWLAEPATISLLRWQSSDEQGADETELMLSAPFYMPNTKKLIERSIDVTRQSGNIQEQLLHLYISGLIREYYWAHQGAEIQFQQAQQKVVLLEKLDEQLTRLKASGQITRFALLLTQQKLNIAKSDVAQRKLTLTTHRKAWFQLTGLEQPVQQIDKPNNDLTFEGARGNGSMFSSLEHHPMIRRLDWAWQNLILSQQSARSEQQNVDVSLGLRRMSDRVSDETQFAIGFSMPITSPNGQLSQFTTNQLQQQQQAILTEMQQQRSELRKQLEQRVLAHAQADLRIPSIIKNAQLAEQAEELLTQLYQRGELSYQQYLEGLLEQLNVRHQVQQSQFEAARAWSWVQQARGISL